MAQQFTVVVERDPKSGSLVGEVAELPGCYTQPQNMDEMEHSIREAIQVYLETCPDTSNLPQSVGLYRVEVNV